MTLEQLHDYLVQREWKQDRFGHYLKGDYRVKIQAISIRFEKRIPIAHYDGKVENKWYRCRSGYLSKLSISEDGKLTGWNS